MRTNNISIHLKKSWSKEIRGQSIFWCSWKAVTLTWYWFQIAFLWNTGCHVTGTSWGYIPVVVWCCPCNKSFTYMYTHTHTYVFQFRWFLALYSQSRSTLHQKSLLESLTYRLPVVHYTVYCEHLHPHTCVQRYVWVLPRDLTSIQKSMGISELKLKHHLSCG